MKATVATWLTAREEFPATFVRLTALPPRHLQQGAFNVQLRLQRVGRRSRSEREGIDAFEAAQSAPVRPRMVLVLEPLLVVASEERERRAA